MTARMPRLLIPVALALLIAPPALSQAPAAPPGAAVSCEVPPDALSAATCADPAARGADRRRARTYEALRHALQPVQRPGLETDARGFEAFLAANCAPGGRPDPACLARAHEAKREDLRRWLTGPALEEADRAGEEAEALEGRLAAAGIPPAPAARREAIAALQGRGGLPATGFLDGRTVALLPAAPARPSGGAAPPAPSATAPPPGTVWLPHFPPALNERYALSGCGAAGTASWIGNGLRLGGRPVPGETGYEIYADPQRFYLLPPGGPARVIEGLPDGSLRLSGTIPPALAARGIQPGATLRRCGEATRR
ncbi:hypothetical protein FHS87_000940 [Roseomonas pecuniae]|uniref:Peptidoglycan binding domain-containing protein n=2 Tax=Muricoccus pecuniae TaxID=693023 RepID=A0A840YA75_9PROT|nr:hypothetical protein [Roseomonas pecuniae]